MAINYTAIATNAALEATTFNAPLEELDTAIKKNNYAASTPPTGTDDYAAGYTNGSRWIDLTNDKAYICVDQSTGAAVWREITFPASASTLRLTTRTLGSDGNVVEAVVSKTNIADDTATEVFQIMTTDEPGSNDGGAYVCDVIALIGHNTVYNATDAAVKQFRGSFARVMVGAGTGVSTAVENTFSGTSAASTSATKDISTVTMTTAENSEYDVRVSLQIDLTGAAAGTAEVMLFIRLVWRGFTTAPVITGL